MKEDQFIRNLTEGKENPFRVPDGYFEAFNRRLGGKLEKPRKQHPTRKWWSVAAAVAVAMVMGLTLLLNFSDSSQPGSTAGKMVAVATGTDEAQYSDEYVLELMDYAMMSNAEIEDYLTQDE